MRRSMLGLVVLAFASSSMMACAADDSPGVPSRSPRTSDTGGAAPGANNAATPPPPAPACTAAEPKPIATEGDAADLRVVDGAVFFRSGKKVIRAAKDGSGKATVYESDTLVRSFVAERGILVAIEDPNPPNAVVKVLTLANPEQVIAEIPTNWNAGGSYVIGVDGDELYAIGDEQEGEVIYKLSAQGPLMQPLVTVKDTISSAQLAAGGLWYVRDRSRVFSIPFAAPTQQDPNAPLPGAAKEGEPREVFGTTTGSCALAVGQDAAFCSAGALLERRDLTGANPRTVLEMAKSKIPAPFGSATWSDGTLYVRTAQPDAAMGHAVRAIKAGAAGVEENIVACGRTAIAEVAVDKDSVVWNEPGKGIFLAPR